jgi:hypothetical protein
MPQRKQQSPGASSASSVSFGATLSACALGPSLPCSALLKRVRNAERLQQLDALVGARLPCKSFHLLYTWSGNGRSASAFHERCDNKVGGTYAFALQRHGSE